VKEKACQSRSLQAIFMPTLDIAQIIIALIAGAPGIIAAISSFRNGGKLKKVQATQDRQNNL
jgi:hypothetical protein